MNNHDGKYRFTPSASHATSLRPRSFWSAKEKVDSIMDTEHFLRALL